RTRAASRPASSAACCWSHCRGSTSVAAAVGRCRLAKPRKPRTAPPSERAPERAPEREPAPASDSDEPSFDYDGKVHFEIPESMPLLPIRDLVVFPYMIVPLLVSREISVEAVNQALSTSKERLVFLAAQKDIGEDDPSPDTIFPIGTVGMIMRMRKLSDGR